MILRNDKYRIDTKQYPYVFKIPVYGIWGGAKVLIKTHEPITSDLRRPR